METEKKETTEKTTETEEHVHGPGCNHGHDHDQLEPIVRTTPKVGRNCYLTLLSDYVLIRKNVVTGQRNFKFIS